MKNRGTAFEWDDLQDIWTQSALNNKIHIEMSDLLKELEISVSQFEMDAIHREFATIEKEISDLGELTTQFEKDAIQKDIDKISRALRNFFGFFKGRD